MKLHLLKINNIPYLGMVFFMLSSCTKEVQVAFPEHEPQLVVNSLFSPYNTISIALGKSKAILDDSEQLPIKDAQILLYENNTKIDSLVWQEETQTFTSNYTAVEGKSYSFALNHNNILLQARDHIPALPVVENSFYKDSIYIGDVGDYAGYFSQLSFTIIDDPNVENFYELVLYFVDKNCPWFGTEDEDFCYSISIPDTLNNDPVILSSTLIDNYYTNTLLFDDNLFNGDTYDLKFNFVTPSSFFIEESTPSDLHYVLKFRKVSKHYYLFKNNFFTHLNNQESDLWDGTGEPISVYSNISNGLGIFAGYNEVIDTIQKQLPQ